MCDTEARHSCVMMLPAWRRGAGGSGQQEAERKGGSRGSWRMEGIKEQKRRRLCCFSWLGNASSKLAFISSWFPYQLKIFFDLLPLPTLGSGLASLLLSILGRRILSLSLWRGCHLNPSINYLYPPASQTWLGSYPGPGFDVNPCFARQLLASAQSPAGSQ